MDMSNVQTAAIYARVSTDDQKCDMQLTELRAYAQRVGWQVTEYLEKQSSVKQRPVLDKLMQDAKVRKFDAVLVWKLDRLARSMTQFVSLVQDLDHCGVRFIAVTQAIDTDRQNPMGKFLMHILAAFAEMERGMIVDRVRAGMREAKRQGKHCGRPPKVWRRDRARELRELGKSWTEIARELEITVAAARRACQKGVSASPGA